MYPGHSASARASPVRPSVEVFGSSASTGAEYLDDDLLEDDDTIDGVMNKLAIERRVQYGAEKMLDVIEKRGGEDGGDQEQMTDRIIAQLEAAETRIKELEGKLEILQRATPQRTKRRPQPRLNAFGSSSSLGQPLSSSYSANGHGNSNSLARPRPSRQRSNLTPDREYPDPITAIAPGQGSNSRTSTRTGPSTPSRAGTSAYPSGISIATAMAGSKSDSANHSRRRSLSTGSFGSPIHNDGGSNLGTSRLGWVPGLETVSPGRIGWQKDGESEMGETDGTPALLDNALGLLRRLKELNRRESAGKGKGKEKNEAQSRDTGRNDEAWICMTKLAALLKRSEGLRALLSIEEVIQVVFPVLGDSSSVRRRTGAYRLLRYVLDRAGWGKMLEAGIEWLLVRTLSRDAKCTPEREQALRLLRACMTLPPAAKPTRAVSRGHSRQQSASRPWSSHSRHGSTAAFEPFTAILVQRVPLPDSLIRALVSVAENPEDVLRIATMQTLIEIGVLDFERLIHSDAFRSVLLVLKDGPAELGPSVTALLMYLVDKPSTRQFLLAGSDLESVLVGLTEEYGKVPSKQQSKHVEAIQACMRNVTLLLGSWPGVLYLCMDDRRAIQSLISSLHVPNNEMRDALLDLFFSALRIKLPTWKDAFLENKRLTVYNRAQEAATSTLLDEHDEVDIPQALNLVDQFIALLLATFIESGLLEALVDLIDENISALNRKATLLLGEILRKANTILPLQYAAQIQSLPRLFSVAMDFSSLSDRAAALSALSSIDSLNRNQAKTAGQQSAGRNIRPSCVQESLARGLQQVQQAKLRLGLQIEDRQFQQMINDTGVLLNRDHTKWNYEIIMELIEGPLLNPKRLDEAIRATKFIRRLFSFFHPYNNWFSAVKRTRPSHKWVKMGCALLFTALASPEGIKYLNEDKLLRQMVNCFAEIDEHSGLNITRPILTRERIERTLTYGYFEMIGTLSKSREGMALLEKFRFFSTFHHLSEQRGKDQIMRIVVECFDYTLDAHPRILLSRTLTSSHMETRLFATHHLGRLLHIAPDLIDWALQLMVTQLYDTSLELCEVAVMYLEEVCTEPEGLEKVVQLRPALEHLGDIGHPLFMRFVATSIGFDYLYRAQYIERELEIWLSEKNHLYVIEVETWVSQTVRPFSSDTVEDYWTYDGLAPTHFLGELTKTPEGCQLLKDRGVISEFAELIRLHGMEGDDRVIMANVKSVLWALGNIGSTTGGLAFLEDEEIVEVLVEIAEQHPVLSMKGTGFFVLGLLSTTRMGAEVLEELGWVSTRTPMGATTGLCLPNNIDRFARIELWTRPAKPILYNALPNLTGVEAEIQTAISNLSNYVLASGAMNNLKRIRNRHPKLFASNTLFHRALVKISSNHYQAPVRRFILELFDLQLDPEVLVQLRHLDDEMRRSRPPLLTHPKQHSNGSDRRERSYRNTRDLDHEREHRRRSASYPGPIPGFTPSSSVGLVSPDHAAVLGRKRGSTVSGFQSSSGDEGY